MQYRLISNYTCFWAKLIQLRTFLCASLSGFVILIVVHIRVKLKSLTAPLSSGRSLTTGEIKFDV